MRKLSSSNKKADQSNKRKLQIHKKSIIPKLIKKERNEKVEFTKQKNQTKKLTKKHNEDATFFFIQSSSKRPTPIFQ
jgi:hypothetical protein